MQILWKNKKIRYETKGKGLPVVLLHGYLESLEIWNDFADGLAERFRVISIDLPGHGKSDTLGEIHTMELLAGAVEQVLAHEKIEKAFLTGHSLGGYVTLAFVEKYAERLSGFCLFHSHPLADSEETKENRKREISLVKEGKKHLICQTNIPKAFAEDNQGKYKDDIERAIGIARETPDEGIIAMLRGMMQRADRTGILEKPVVPGLWILGEKDQYIPYEKMRSVVYPGDLIQVSPLKNSGHMGFIEEKENSLQIMTRFLNTLPHA